jgi:hypothetical protein
MKRQREQNSRAARMGGEDIELGFIAKSHVTLVVSPFEIKEVRKTALCFIVVRGDQVSIIT